MTRNRPYTGYDKDPGGVLPGMREFIRQVEAMTGRGLWNNGSYGRRSKRGKPGNTSVHQSSRAVDLSWRGGSYPGFGDYEKADAIVEWLVEHNEQLKLEYVADYLPRPGGRGWRCDRIDSGGWKTYKAGTIKGAPGGDWYHIELAPGDHMNSPDYYRETFAALLQADPIDPDAPEPVEPTPADDDDERSEFPGNIRIGSRGDHVKPVQERIGATVDGWYGPQSARLTRKWQADHQPEAGPVDGWVGRMTWAAMFGT